MYLTFGKKTPPLGIEPRTCRLTAERSTNWAMEAGCVNWVNECIFQFPEIGPRKTKSRLQKSKNVPQGWLSCEGTLSERLRRQIRNLLGFARAGSNPAGVVVFSSTFWLTYSELVQWPSGLRRSTQVRVSSEAWVRTPLEPHLFYFVRTTLICHSLFL